ncbi:capsular polysaccharide biosynthesis protein [Geotalea uraniireducens]|uniref:Capsular polysaccharide biosynthesis protein n=1 Tax=Geotalea uraniireducens TaxID=351604 RepID=A0ABN6VPH7_9BACT|nr:capsular polysaccharide biosynthesis protein [Geotalea uraniireducens]
MKFLPLVLFAGLWLGIGYSSATAAEITINFVGDIMLAGSATSLFDRQGYDYPFSATAPLLQTGDLCVGNLEAPITRTGTEFTEKRYHFRTNPAATIALRHAGFSVLTLANNHMMDFGAQGLRETLANLNHQGIQFTGAGESLNEARRAALVRVKGKTIAFLAYSLTQPVEFFATGNSAGTAPGYALFYQEDVRKARAVADYVIVSFHWGEERRSLPKPYQTAAAHRAIDAGADAVIGHHPHVLQGIEIYRGKPILYSLGNFAFGSRSTAAAHSIIGRIHLADAGSYLEILPLNVLYSDVRYQPQPANREIGRKIIRHLATISRPFRSRISCENGRYLVKYVDHQEQDAIRTARR